AEDALRESENRFREVVEGTDNLVTRVDASGRFLYVNPMARKIFGLEPEHCLGRLAFDFVHPDDREATKQAFNGWLTDRLIHATFENRQVSQAGEVRHLSWNIDLHFDSGGGITVIDGIAHDVTELKNVQLQLEDRVAERTEELRNTVQALEVAKTRAEAASKVKSAFLMNLSHELRTPLSPIVALTELMLGAELPPAEQREYLQLVHGASQRLLTLFNRLFELLDLEGYAFVPGVVDLGSFKDLVLHELTPAAQAKGLTLAGSVAPELPQYVWADMHLLHLTVQELVQNAVRFTEAGGVSLALSLRARADDRVTVCIEIADTGIGIPEDRIEAIRSGLTQGDTPLTKHYGGLGVGMAKASRAIALLGGQLEIDSHPGRGTAMRIVLPLRVADLDEDGGLEYVRTPGGDWAWRGQ
ncbi:MAG: hypothetical protein C0405_08070, partial [Desulfovibrio sp.]|nr:hypothetical protein [Desulfovibrio sp.]